MQRYDFYVKPAIDLKIFIIFEEDLRREVVQVIVL